MEQPASVAPFYQGWRLTNEQLAGMVATATPQQLQLSAAPHQWPTRAIVNPPWPKARSGER